MVITRPVVTALVVCLAGALGLAAKPVAKTPVKYSTAKARTAAKTAVSTVNKRVPTKTPLRTPLRTVRVVKKPIAPSAPGSERVREVQKALIERGYLQTQASGYWDAASVEAMKRFESDRKVKVDGKIDAKMLIALGLGPKYDSEINLPSIASGAVAADQNNDQQRF